MKKLFITETKTGFKVNKQIDGVKYRAVYPSAAEADIALATVIATGVLPPPSNAPVRRQVRRGGAPKLADSVLTVSGLYDLALRRGRKPWTPDCKPAQVFRWLADNYLGWDMAAAKIDMPYVNAMIEWLGDRGDAPATVNRKLAALRRAMNLAYRDELIDRVPYFEARRESTGRIRVFSYDEEEKILECVKAVWGFQWYAFIKLMFETGCRPSELGRLEGRDVDLNKGLLQIWQSKSDQPRVVPLTDEACRVLAECDLVESEDVFGFYDIHKLDKLVWRDVREHLGAYGKDFVPYVCRHTCASRLVASGVNIQVVKEWMGHSTITTTQRYVKLFSVGAMAGAAESLRTLREDSGYGTSRPSPKSLDKSVEYGSVASKNSVQSSAYRY